MAPESEGVRTRTLLAACGFGAIALVAVAALLVLGLRDTGPVNAIVATRPATTAPSLARPTAMPDGQLFAPTSFWNERLPATTALDPNSTALVQALVAEVGRERAAGKGPWISASSGSTPLYRVGRTQRRVRVRLQNPGNHGGKALQRAFASVPIPTDAKAAIGPDRHMTVWQPSTDTLWEFFGARRRSGAWEAQWGGAIRQVSRSPGYYTHTAWPGATYNWGATASSLPVVAGTMLLDELQAGRIDHALAMNLPAPRAGVFAWPAQRTDGTGDPATLPEGARLRLDPTLDVGALQLPKLTRMIALAAQRYGFVVRDQTHNGISLFAENPSQFPGHPYQRYFRGRTPPELLARFPWDRLQLVQMHLCTRAPCRRG